MRRYGCGIRRYGCRMRRYECRMRTIGRTMRRYGWGMRPIARRIGWYASGMNRYCAQAVWYSEPEPVDLEEAQRVRQRLVRHDLLTGQCRFGFGAECRAEHRDECDAEGDPH